MVDSASGADPSSTGPSPGAATSVDPNSGASVSSPTEAAAGMVSGATSPATGTVDVNALATDLQALDPQDPRTAEITAAVEAQLSPVQRGELAAAQDAAAAATAQTAPARQITLNDQTVVTAFQGQVEGVKTLAELRDSPVAEDRATFQSIMDTYGSIEAAEQAMFGQPTTPANETIELDPITVTADAPPATPTASPSQEGIGSFFEGMVMGDFSDNRSWSATAGQVIGGFIPGLGQAGDVRDTVAAVNALRNGEPGAGWGLAAAIVGFAPGGDLVKGMIRGERAVEGAGEVLQGAARNADPATPASRPTWRQSENDVGADLGPGYDAQRSFRGGQEVPYGSPGSTRPDFYTSGHSIEVKNYRVETAAQRSRLVDNISAQAITRAREMPAGTRQSVEIDVRGQQLSPSDAAQLARDIESRSGGAIRATDVTIRR
ncbi:hypothetical protein OK349_05460 [Sphingomonas sp. BT-65]|uniref:hypothetical protein n=1 Tax=Sphingomonas sp. BT-65 TaxID=2989821 RepID=UPI0022363D1B|nr:hypothetical protein [Sphingomonas sp. BT-65]MCW4461147.1 hypothetical protein [Sphingomonas sp. BT-65]